MQLCYRLLFKPVPYSLSCGWDACRPPMQQCEVAPSTENVEGSSLHLENKGAGEDATADSAVAPAAVTTNPGIYLYILLVFVAPSRKSASSLPVRKIWNVLLNAINDD